MAQVKRNDRTAQLPAATMSRNFRTFLLMAQFEAQEIGARLAQARNEKGLTQEELAEMASFSKRSLQAYEAGETIPYRHFQEIGRLLGKPTEWFLYGDKPRTNGDGDPEQEKLVVAVQGLLNRINSERADRRQEQKILERRLAALERSVNQLAAKIESRS